MLLLPILVSLVLAQPKTTVSDVSCQTVADCWIDADAKPIERPKKYRGKAIPRGDCSKKLLWLRNKLTCEQNLCTVTHIGDKC